jgi:hypothetical protein
MNTQDKVTAALRQIAISNGLELVQDTAWANTGVFHFQWPDSFDDLLALRYAFHSSSLSSLVPTRGADDVQHWYFGAGEGERIEMVLADIDTRLKAALRAKPDRSLAAKCPRQVRTFLTELAKMQTPEESGHDMSGALAVEVLCSLIQRARGFRS